MAEVMDSTDRDRTANQFMRDCLDRYGIAWPNAPKEDIRTAVGNLDDLLVSSATAINNALPVSVQAGSKEFKALLVAFVAMRRAGRKVLKAEED
jgi:hypothetical protein